MPYSEEDRVLELARVDPLILAGGVCLAFVAGYVNAVSLCYFHVPVSHMTGAVTRLSIDMAALHFPEFIKISYIFSGFLSGAVFSGIVIGARNRKQSVEYPVLLTAEAALLFASVALFQSKASPALFAVAFACGLQNAMASNYLGLIIRTTHMTGIVTDLGVLIGHALRHRRIRLWKIGFLLSILIGFFAGGAAGFFIFGKVDYRANFVPATMCLIGAAGFYLLRVRKSGT